MATLTAPQGMAAIADVLVSQDTRTTQEKLEALKAGDVIVFGTDRHAYKAGVEYRVVGIERVSVNRFDIGLLESGKPATEMVEGKYLAAGTMVELSNVITTTWYATAKDYGSFAIVS
jgi:hypothetical protein